MIFERNPRGSGVQHLVRRLLPGSAAPAVETGPHPVDFFKANIVFHTHVEKSAGTTLVETFKLLFGPDRIHDIRNPAVARPSQLSPREKAAICVLTGHFHYGRMDRFFARRPVYVACVRHPVSRFFSYYKYVSTRPDHPGYRAMVGKSFDDVVVDYIEARHHSITSPMSRMLTGKRSPSSDTTLNHVQNNYLMIVPQQRVDDLVIALFHAFGKDGSSAVGRRNVGGYQDKPSDSAAELILAANQSDLQLYDYACREFDAMLDNAIRLLITSGIDQAAAQAPGTIV